ASGSRCCSSSFFFSSRRRHTRWPRDWSSDVCSSDLTVGEMAIVMLSLPFALVGGVWIIWLLGYNLSIAAAVGFIALAGVAAETGVVMLVYLDHAWKDIAQEGRRPTLPELVGAKQDGAVHRVRPKLMTVLAIMLS